MKCSAEDGGLFCLNHQVCAAMGHHDLFLWVLSISLSELTRYIHVHAKRLTEARHVTVVNIVTPAKQATDKNQESVKFAMDNNLSISLTSFVFSYIDNR